ncbi:hypothetical protein TNCV_3535041 [Trichonephila clavipes]|nr:hypothetical protein TNCV_3535041 [Trichonephila clavipes]
MAEQPMRAKASVPNSVFVTLGTEVHKQMFQSGGQSDANSQCLVPEQTWHSFCNNLVEVIGVWGFKLKSVPFSRSNPTNESPVDQATREKMGVATIDGPVDCPPDLIAILKANTRCLVSWRYGTHTRKKTYFQLLRPCSSARCR